MRVMIVDDSVVFRSQLKNCLEGQEGITVVGAAANGKIALERIEQAACDLITLDLEMPEMNGLEFLAEKKRRNLPQKVIVFAAPNKEGGAQVLAALAAGADDFIAKPASATSLDEALEGIRRELLPKILQFKRRQDLYKSSEPAPSAAAKEVPLPIRSAAFPQIILETFKARIVVIASSTGGPTALEKLFTMMKGHKVNVPILIAQHMPPNFTESLAKRLEAICGLPAAEGKAGELILPGRIYVAPGDYHMSIGRLPETQKPIIKIDQGPKRNSVRPAADFLFETAAREYGATTAGFVLTGMGEDGKDGAISIKKASGAVMIQDRHTSVVWGMPGAVHDVGAFDREGDLESCGKILQCLCR